MCKRKILKSGPGLVLAVGVVLVFLAGVGTCTTAPIPFVVQGPGFTDNEPPSLTILEPITDQTRDQGAVFLVRWVDSDRDSNATISFSLIDTLTNAVIPLVQGIDENDTIGTDSVSVGTSAIPIGQYNLLGIIADDENPPVQIFAVTTDAATAERVIITIVPPGQGRPTRPPQVTVTEPMFNLSMAQDDILRVSVQPTPFPPNEANPFDSDSNMRLFILLDLDLDPNNDDPGDPSDPGIILLQEQVVPVGFTAAIPFDIAIDLNMVPPRPDGRPYFIRATVDDLSNPRVHQYAVGTISVVELAAGLVDLADIGRTKAGAKFYGFNPGANMGSSVTTIGDFDADGIDDFVLVAQFGNPRNVGLVGEAYLIYGQDEIRFGGSIAVNSVGESVNGVIFEAPPIRRSLFLAGLPRSDGITSVSFVRDLSGDGRPELLFGLPHVHGAVETMDFDPGDEPGGEEATENVEVVLRQGFVSIEIGDDPIFEGTTFFGVEDLTLSSSDPNNGFGAANELRWQNNPAANEMQWGLIKFTNVLDRIPDINNPALIDITSVTATLEVRVFNTGGDAAIHQVLTNFTEQTAFNSFAVGGGAPQAGVDYVANSLGTISADTAEPITVDVSGLVVQLIDGQLAQFANEIRLIIVPAATDAENEAAVRSSENGIEPDRPALRINYTRTSSFGSVGCYPDPLANNKTDTNDSAADLYFFGGGMALMVNSQNRDSRSVTGVNRDRLESTVITLELVGQEGGWIWDAEGFNLGSGNIFTRADNTAVETDEIGNDSSEPGRISGARFTGGWFDFIDHLRLRQPPRDGLFGQTVSSIGDLNNDGLDEIIISAPRNERYIEGLLQSFGSQSTHWWSTGFRGSIAVIPGTNYNTTDWRDRTDDGQSTSSIPFIDHYRFGAPYGSCSQGTPRHGPFVPADMFEVFAEDIDDMLGGAGSAGDFNQDGLDDLLCGAYLNDRPGREDTGAVYILYSRNVLGNFNLALSDDVFLRAPMLRIRGVKPGDQIGWRQTSGLDVNGDRIGDVFIASPRTDFGGVIRSSCRGSYCGDRVVDPNFTNCRIRFAERAEDLFCDDACKVFDYDNDADIDDDDRTVFDCLEEGGADCCENLVDNGFVGIIFGGVFVDGDRDITQIATSDLPGTIFFGSGAGHRAGVSVSSAGDYNQDGFGDLLIAVPGETRLDSAGRKRLGVVYLIFGGTHLENAVWSLSQVGSDDLPGIVFLSPFVHGRPNEAPPTTVAFLGDVNNDGFGDICIGNPRADFIDLSFPQGPNAPGGDAEVGRRRNAGEAYIVYGNNFGSNRGSP